MKKTPWTVAALAALALLSNPVMAADQPSVLAQTHSSGISFDAQVAHAGSVLTLSGPDGFYLTRTFDEGESAYLAVNDDELGSLPDGQYSYELTLQPRIDAATRAAMVRARATGDEGLVASLMKQGKIPSRVDVAYGYFTVLNGAVVTDLDEGGLESASGDAATGFENVSAADIIHGDDVIINGGSLCVGFDCVNGESFGFDTARLKENNLRLHFDDTSNSASFPNNDWRIRINDTSNGGASYFAIEDSTAGRDPFRVVAGAPANSLYVDAQGDVGLGTNNPVVELHIADGDTPTLRLEQNGTSGFTPQTWDLAGNETNIFIRDATNGSTLPFRIRPSAPTSSIDVASDGDVGMGTSSPAADLHVRRTNSGSGSAGADLLVEDASSTESARILATFRNNGRALIELDDTSGNGSNWRLRTVESAFTIDGEASAMAVNELLLDAITGDMTIQGTYQTASSRDLKTNIQEVDPQEVLEKVVALPVSTWSYKTVTDQKHIGPMAQDFYAAFGFGATDTTLATTDTAGVALAAIQALHQQAQQQARLLQQKQEEIDLLEERLAALEEKLAD